MEPIYTLFLDTEAGTTSIRDLIGKEWRTDEQGNRTSITRNDSGLVTVEHCETLAQLSAAYWRVKRKQYDPMPHVVALDSLTALAASHKVTIVRESQKAAAAKAKTIWRENLEGAALLDLVPDQREYGITNHNIIDVLWPIRRLPQLTIFTAHDRINEDSVSKDKKIGPAVSPQLLSDVLNFTDDAFRLTSCPKPETIDGKMYPKKTRVLRIDESTDYSTKIRISRKMTIPEILVNPTLWTVRDTLKDFMPDHLVLFGPRGAGKTVFCASFSDPSVYPTSLNQTQSTGAK